MEYKNIKLELEDGIAVVTIARPKALNALNTHVINELIHAFEWIDKAAEAKAAILTGEGRAFVAGADISQMKDLDIRDGRDMTLLGQGLMELIETIDKPVIAAVNGFALGGGCEISMACDIRICSEKARFGQPEVNLGIIPGYGGTQRLPRLVGKGMAKYLLMTGEQIDAQEAYRIGLVQKVVPAEELMDQAKAIAETIMAKAPVAIKMAKHAVNNGMNVDLRSGVAYEAEAYTTTFSTKDRTEGMTAFVEKRTPSFENR